MRDIIIDTFVADVAVYLGFEPARRVVMKRILTELESFGPSGPDLIVARSLGTAPIAQLLALPSGVAVGNGVRVFVAGSPLHLTRLFDLFPTRPTHLSVASWLHVYDDGEIVAGGRPLSHGDWLTASNYEVENFDFPSSHGFEGYMNARGLIAALTTFLKPDDE